MQLFAYLAVVLLALVSSTVAAPVTSLQSTALPSSDSANSTLEARGSFGGKGTYYFQGGAWGSCGKKNKDSALIVAMPPSVGGYNRYCNKKVKITNKSNGKSVTAIVSDTCPGCAYGSLDLSTGAYDKIGARSTGVLPIKWTFV